jgi:hypothetical protein
MKIITPLIRRSALILTTSLVLTAASAMGQQAGTVQLRLITLPPKTEHPALKLLQGAGESLPVETAASRLTGPYKVAKQEFWTFVVATPPVANEPAPAALAKIRALASANQLVVLVKEPNPNGKYGGFALNTAKDAFAERQFLIVNLSPLELAAEIGGKRVALAPGKPVVVKPTADQGPDLCHATIFSRAGAQWQPFFSTNWPLRDKVRGLVFLYQESATGKILLHAVTDFLE